MLTGIKTKETIVSFHDDALRDACPAWRGARDGGYSPIRVVARATTQTKHYSDADFITRLELTSPLPAIPARAASDIKTNERGLIAGGRYKVADITTNGNTAEGRLRYDGPVWSR